MIEIASLNNMIKSDKYTCENVISSKELMFKAGKACADEILKRYPSIKSAAIVCGKGNNAGDGYVIGGLLKDEGIEVTFYLLSSFFSSDGKYFYESAVKNGCKVQEVSSSLHFDEDVIIDCIFGTGFKGKVSELSSSVINKINNSSKDVVSIDINSGMNGDTGLGEVIVSSSLTIAINNYKPGHFLNMAKDVMKDKTVVEIGINLIDQPYYLFEEKDIKFRPRKNYSTKRDYGYVGLIGGSLNYSGAIRLANMALCSVISGAGVVKLATINSLAQYIIPNILESTFYPLSEIDNHFLFNEEEISSFIKNLKVIGVGMGLTNNEETSKLIKYLLSNYDGILLIDADGLNALGDIDDKYLLNTKAKVVLTPHLYEFSRISKYSVDEINESPIAKVKEYSSKYNVVTLLKGPTTIISDGQKVYLVDKGCPGMAKGGSGDVLSGLLVGLLTEEDKILDIVTKGAYINGLAGENAKKEYSEITMTPGDTVNCIKKIIDSYSK